MEEIQSLASTVKVATPYDHVYKNECVYTFHTPLTQPETGLLVNLTTWVGTVQEMAMHMSTDDNEKKLFLRILMERKRKDPPAAGGEGDGKRAPPPKPEAPTKLGIGVEGGFVAPEEKYEIKSHYSVVVLQQQQQEGGEGSVPPKVITEVPYTDETKNDFPLAVAQAVDAIINHVGVATQQDVAAWQMDEDEIPVSKYANENLPFVDNGVVIDPNPKTWKCAKSGDTENLWLNLSDGYIGGGRKHWDGSGGSNGALDHFNETGQQYPLVVKLGTITADTSTADCYSYAPDEDGPVKVPNLADLLAKRGIHVAGMQKTVKSTAELEVELNANYAFDAITEAGAELTPVSGPGLQGLQNLGNSCYMNSVVQLFFSGTIPELSKRYGAEPGGSLTQHPILKATSSSKAPEDILCQTTKLANALTSGHFRKPIVDGKEEEDDDNDPKYRLTPRMLKHAVGRNHVDFKTAQQQDAAQFLQYYLEQLDRSELASAVLKSTIVTNEDKPLHVASHLFSFGTTTRMVCQADHKVKYTETAAPETLWSLRIPMEKATTTTTADDKGETVTSPDQKRFKETPSPDNKKDEEKQPVPRIAFSTCVEEWAAETVVDDVRWPHLQDAKFPATQTLRFTNFPRYLMVQMQRYTLGPDWSPVKLEVNLDITDEIDLTPYKSHGPATGEDLVPSVEASTTGDGAAAASKKPDPPSAIDEAALGQLMDMGFSMNSCKRALAAVGGSNVEAAMGWVFEHNNDPDFNDPLPEDGGASSPAASSNSNNVDEGVVQSLVENLGCFTFDQVRAALQETNGAADRAADWLFSHMDDLDGAIAALQSKQQGDGGGNAAAASKPKIPLEDSESGKYVLTGMISHIGKNTGSGHYVAHLKKDGKWVIFNDEKVALSSKPPYEHAYLYLFQRADTIGAPNPNY